MDAYSKLYNGVKEEYCNKRNGCSNPEKTRKMNAFRKKKRQRAK
jgi:hypothetical protein